MECVERKQPGSSLLVGSLQEDLALYQQGIPVARLRAANVINRCVSICYSAGIFRSCNQMRSMTGYGRGESERDGAKISVEVNSVNRKQSDIVINLPRELSALEPRVRQAVSDRLTRGRTNVVVALERNASAGRNLALDGSARPFLSRRNARFAERAGRELARSRSG